MASTRSTESITRSLKKPEPQKPKKSRPKFTGQARPHYVSRTTVYEAALDRVRWLFDEFDGNVSVSNSGGKDSTVVLELAAIVARERGSKLRVVWLDQEAEFQGTVDYQRYIMYERDDIDFDWYQVPFKMVNATSHDHKWLNVWGEGEEWIRDKEPESIHSMDELGRPSVEEIGYEVPEPTRFQRVLSAINGRTSARGFHPFKDSGVVLTGMRAQEAPGRRLLMTSGPEYKWITWTSRASHKSAPAKKYMAHPIFDWSHVDIWKAIHDHGWRYNKMYDLMYQYGVPARQMRVSNYHHSEAVGSLEFLQEVEPETWEAATRRLTGINAQGQLGGNAEQIDELPYMFSDWHEYCEHLIENLVQFEDDRKAFRDLRNRIKNTLEGCDVDDDTIERQIIKAVLLNGVKGVSLENWVLTKKRDKKVQSGKAAVEAKRIQKMQDDAMLGDEDDAEGE